MEEDLKQWLASDRAVSMAAHILEWRTSEEEREATAAVLADYLEQEDGRTGPLSIVAEWRTRRFTPQLLARWLIQMFADGRHGLLHPYLGCTCKGCRLVRAVRDPDDDPPLILTPEIPPC